MSRFKWAKGRENEILCVVEKIKSATSNSDAIQQFKVNQDVLFECDVFTEFSV